ncbi:MAG: protein kinase [Lachnospiraceae bacterium]
MKMVTEQESGKRALREGTILRACYRVDGVLGEGGFGITYAARQLDTGKKVAIKEYFPAAYATRDNADLDQNLHVFLTEKDTYNHGMKRFLQEAEILKSVQFLDGIVSVMDCFTCNQTAYIVMEYIEGITLKQYIQDIGCLEYDELLELLIPVMKSLNCIHRQGLLHRDISPDNLLIGLDNKARLIDFGAADMMDAKNKKEMTVIFKSGYAPPEQYLTDGKQGPWMDVYALAAVMYMALTGRTPVAAVARLQGKQMMSFEQCHVKLPQWTEQVIQTGMALKISDRYKNVEEFLNDLMKVPKIEDEVTQFQSEPSRKVRAQIAGLNRQKRRILWMSVCLVLAVVLFVWWILNRYAGDDQFDIKHQKQSNTMQSDQLLYVMPDVTGLPESDAKELIRSTDDAIQIIVQYRYSENKKGTVIEQNVAADTQYSAGVITEIILTVSMGGETTTKESTTQEIRTTQETATEETSATREDTTKKQTTTTQASKKEDDVDVIEEKNYDEFQID